MISDTKKMIEFLGEHNMSPSQFFLCWILYLDKQEHKGNSLPTEGKAIANIYRYIELIGKWSYEDIRDLVERGYLSGQEDGEGLYYPDQMVVTDKFVDAVFASMDDFEKFVEEYPSFVENFNDPRKEEIPLKAVDMEKVEALFSNKVQAKVEFERLMKSLQWAKENDKIKMNIRNYLSGEIWKSHYKKMKEGSTKIREKTIN